MQRTDVCVVGAGLAGLACALELIEAGRSVAVCESSRRVGGRVATDEIDADGRFLLDRGFQVFLPAYPEAGEILDLEALDLRPLAAGALVRRGGGLQRFFDPRRHPGRFIGMLRDGLFEPADFARLARMRWQSRRAARRGFPERHQSARRYLVEQGFSRDVLEGLWMPFFGGVFLDERLEVPAEHMQFVFEMFVRGGAALPAQGMVSIPKQLADRLPRGVVRGAAGVGRLFSDGVALADSSAQPADAVVVATDIDTARTLGVPVPAADWTASTTLYFAADRSPLGEPVLVVNGEGRGPVNTVCVPSDAAPAYAPAGASLVSVAVIGNPPGTDADLDAAVREQLGGWFGRAVDAWRLLRIDRVRHALPRLDRGQAFNTHWAPGRYVCGDWTGVPSINTALASGRRTARTLLGEVR